MNPSVITPALAGAANDKTIRQVRAVAGFMAGHSVQAFGWRQGDASSFGCTGAKLSIQLLNEMRRRNQKYGMVTACVGGGQGIAGIFERLN